MKLPKSIKRRVGSDGYLYVLTAAVFFISALLYFSEQSRTKGSWINGIPAGVNTFLNNTDITSLEVSNFPVFRGETPPQLSGIYRLNTLKVQYDAKGVLPAGRAVDPYRYTFSQQQPDGSIRVDLLSDVPNHDRGASEKSFISGNGNCFTIYMDQKGVSRGCSYTMPALFSGCIATGSGIMNPQETFIMKAKSCDDTTLMPIGNIRTNVETDKLAQIEASVSATPAISATPNPYVTSVPNTQLSPSPTIDPLDAPVQE